MIKQVDGVQFVELITAVSEMYGKPISDFGIDMWFDDLQEYGIEQIKRAFKAHRTDPLGGKFMPKPADIVRHIDGLPTEHATEAWLKLIYAVKSVGSWRDVIFDDLAIHAAIEAMGGWVKLCAMTNDDLPFKQRDFEKIYQQQVKNTHVHIPRLLTGLASLANGSKYENPEKPALIGNKDQCKQFLIDSKNQKPKHPEQDAIAFKNIGELT